MWQEKNSDSLVGISQYSPGEAPGELRPSGRGSGRVALGVGNRGE